MSEIFEDNANPKVDEAFRKQNAIAMECLQHLFHAIPFGTEFPLSNGMTGRLKKFVEPRDNDTRGLEAGVDVQLVKDGHHIGEIEFFITKTGWGMMLVDPVAKPADPTIPSE